MVNAVLDAADTMQAAGYRPEILKLRTISPVDWDAIDARPSGRQTRVRVRGKHPTRECLADEIFAHLIETGIPAVCRKRNLGRGFIPHGAPAALLAAAGLDADSLTTDAGGAFLMKHKERLDVLLVARNLAESRSKAQAMIMAGEVYVNEQKADKAGLEINIDDEPVIEVRGSACPYVSRGGLKLEKALPVSLPQASYAATPVRRPAALPTCCSRGPVRSSPSTSAMASLRRKFVPTRAWS